MASLFCSLSSFCLILVFIIDYFSCVSSLEPRVKPKRISESNKYDQDLWLHQPQERHHRKLRMSKRARNRGGISSSAFTPSEEAAATALRRDSSLVESPSALKQDKVEVQHFEFPFNQRENQPPGYTSKGKKHNREHRRSSQKDRGKHHSAKGFEGEPSGLLKEDLSFKDHTLFTHLEVSSSAPVTFLHLSTANPLYINEQPTAVLETSRRMRAPGKKGGDVMPTLDMTLFDWTDYEDLKPDSWPSVKKKGKLQDNSHNTTNEEEPCDHHLDCLPGSCCDLREHLCKAHNRGLNNKCYDDCMCAEGFRCYAKFHRNQRVTRRKGRCVDPETINRDQGSFISV
ncbi:draxin [Bombina bombina]|uniref:draxin n=1 Tax=Bombina bombina TaxID=8345 RepID=UPI00235ACC70|nr:draxin [Bombina bombina]